MRRQLASKKFEELQRGPDHQRTFAQEKQRSPLQNGKRGSSKENRRGFAPRKIHDFEGEFRLKVTGGIRSVFDGSSKEEEKTLPEWTEEL